MILSQYAYNTKEYIKANAEDEQMAPQPKTTTSIGQNSKINEKKTCLHCIKLNNIRVFVSKYFKKRTLLATETLI